MQNVSIPLICVTAEGILSFQVWKMRCALGLNGLSDIKCEGDKKTPTGTFPLRELFIRPDRISLDFIPALPLTLLKPEMGWCDDPAHPEYNRPVSLPFKASHEILWRQDHRYDVIIPLGYNDSPPVAGKGSAIFFHLASEDYTPTEGCVAISRQDMERLLPHLTPDTQMQIG